MFRTPGPAFDRSVLLVFQEEQEIVRRRQQKDTKDSKSNSTTPTKPKEPTKVRMEQHPSPSPHTNTPKRPHKEAFVGARFLCCHIWFKISRTYKPIFDTFSIAISLKYSSRGWLYLEAVSFMVTVMHRLEAALKAHARL